MKSAFLSQIASFLLLFWRKTILFFLILKSHFWRVLFSTIGIPFALTVLIAGSLLIKPVKSLLKNQMKQKIPATWIKATSNKVKQTPSLLNLFSKNQDVAFGISAATIRQIQRWPEVTRIYKTQILQKPASASLKHPLLGKMGTGFRFDIMLQGVSEDILLRYVNKKYKAAVRKPNPQNLPVFIPEAYAQLVTSYAMVNGLPVVNLKEIPDLKLVLYIGQSIMRTETESLSVEEAPIAGYLPSEFISAIGVPLSWVRQYHIKHNMKKAANSYDQIFVRVNSVSLATKVIRRLQKLGLKVYPPQKQNYNAMIRVLDKLDLIGNFALLLVLFMLATLTANAFIGITLRHQYEYGLFLMSGSSTIYLWGTLFLEGALWGFLYSYLSYASIEKFFPVSIQYVDSEFWKGLLNLAKQEMSTFPKVIWFFSISLLCGMSAWLPSFLLVGRNPLNLIRKSG
ncbi:MAG: hypothetical protein D6767_02825 [Candidatus Hydrogenedentota bacterium]|nr:MAG: hypothetical protein D6767_02825 [Candidatus Hydrogenedentota bacterium]